MNISLILFLLLIVLILVKTPITFALALVSIFYFLLEGLPLTQFVIRMAGGLDIFTLLAAPLFIFAGQIMNHGGITKRLFRFANSIVGHIRGGLGHVNIVTSMLFAGMSGSAIGDAAGLGPIEIKAMTDAGYDKEFSTAVTAASAVIGPIIPPSTIMIMYGVTAEISVSQLFLGGILPGISIGIAEMVMVYFYSIKRHYPRRGHFSLKEFWLSFKDSVFALLAPIIIMGGILGGIFTPTEAGAFAALYAVIISVFVYKEITLKDCWEIMFESSKTSGVILILVATASVFGWCLVFEQVPQAIATFLVNITSNKSLILLMFSVLYMVLGMIMEATAIVVTTVPIIVPLFKILGIDLVYFGVLIGILMSIGTITPPVGTVMFTLCKITGIPIEKFSKVIFPWLLLLLGIIVILILFPQIITTLPALFNS